MIYKSELAVNRTASDELGGLDVDVFGRLMGRVTVEAAHGHQARQGRAFLVSVGLQRVQLAARPAPHVPGAVQCAESVSVCRQKTSHVYDTISFLVFLDCVLGELCIFSGTEHKIRPGATEVSTIQLIFQAT